MKMNSKIAFAAVTFGLLGMTSATMAAGASTGQALTQQECSACHMAFPAPFLPKRSWRKIMGTLDNHFGEDASLDTAAVTEIQHFLEANAADAGGQNRWVMSGVKDTETPTRITEMPWWVRQHNSWEVSAAAFKRVGSKANCVACHRGAERGYYDDD